MDGYPRVVGAGGRRAGRGTRRHPPRDAARSVPATTTPLVRHASRSRSAGRYSHDSYIRGTTQPVLESGDHGLVDRSDLTTVRHDVDGAEQVRQRLVDELRCGRQRPRTAPVPLSPRGSRPRSRGESRCRVQLHGHPPTPPGRGSRCTPRRSPPPSAPGASTERQVEAVDGRQHEPDEPSGVKARPLVAPHGPSIAVSALVSSRLGRPVVPSRSAVVVAREFRRPPRSSGAESVVGESQPAELSRSPSPHPVVPIP